MRETLPHRTSVPRDCTAYRDPTVPPCRRRRAGYKRLGSPHPTKQQRGLVASPLPHEAAWCRERGGGRPRPIDTAFGGSTEILKQSYTERSNLCILTQGVGGPSGIGLSSEAFSRGVLAAPHPLTGTAPGADDPLISSRSMKVTRNWGRQGGAVLRSRGGGIPYLGGEKKEDQYMGVDTPRHTPKRRRSPTREGPETPGSAGLSPSKVWRA